MIRLCCYLKLCNGLLIAVLSFSHKIFMRVLFCKIHCPFICFCKPSPHIYTPGPLKLENNLHVPPSIVSIPDAVNPLSADPTEVKNGKQPDESHVKSSLKKAPSEPGTPKEAGKKKVQWMDLLGKELVEIKEFESRWIFYPYLYA